MHPLVQAVRGVLFGTGAPRTIVRGIATYIRDNAAELGASPVVSAPLAPGRYLCYQDSDYGFTVMLIAWAPGDATPIHDHGTWGVEFVLRSSLEVTRFSALDPLNPAAVLTRHIHAGEIETNVPPEGDIHQVKTPSGESALSLHIYGRALDQCRVFAAGAVVTKPLIATPWESGLAELRCRPPVRRVNPDVRRGAFAET